MIRNKSLMSLFGAAALLWLLAAPVRAEQPDIVDKVGTAETAADHVEIAEYYEREAAGERAEAERHRNLARAYKRVHQRQTGKRNMHDHCVKVAERLEANAKVHEMMAKMHRGRAEQGK